MKNSRVAILDTCEAGSALVHWWGITGFMSEVGNQRGIRQWCPITPSTVHELAGKAVGHSIAIDDTDTLVKTSIHHKSTSHINYWTPLFCFFGETLSSFTKAGCNSQVTLSGDTSS